MSDWDEIVHSLGPMVFGVTWRILGHAADAEDVVQEVFIEALRLQHSQAVKHWAPLLRRLATYRALDRLRQRRTAVSLNLNGHALVAHSPGPEEVAVGRELATRLRGAVGQLAKQEAEVFCLRYFEDLSYQAIAETLGVSPQAVATALHKARARLAVLLEEAVRGE